LADLLAGVLNRIEFLAGKKKIEDWQNHSISLDDNGKIKSVENSAHFAFHYHNKDKEVCVLRGCLCGWGVS
jgi:hypothetical protein